MVATSAPPLSAADSAALVTAVRAAASSAPPAWNLPRERPDFATTVPRALGASERVFLTGATGFLGAHLLAELLRSATLVTCLVRSERGIDAVVANLRAYGLGDAAAAAAKIRVIRGDLGAEKVR